MIFHFCFFSGFVLVSVFWILLVKLGVRGGKENRSPPPPPPEWGRRSSRTTLATTWKCGGAVLCTIYVVAKVSGLLGPDSLRRPKRPNFLCQRLSSHFAERPRWKKCHSSPLWRETIDCTSSAPTVPLAPPTSPPFHFTHPSLRFGSAWMREGSPIFWYKKIMRCLHHLQLHYEKDRTHIFLNLSN